MAESIRASVLVTCFNHADYIAEALQSVYAQTEKSIEIIVIDDGSTDGSQEVLEALVIDPVIPITYISQSNQGQAAAWNRAFRESTGPAIFFLDGDDVWHPDKVSRMLALIAAYPDGGLFQHRLEGDIRNAAHFGSGEIFADWRDSGEMLNVAEEGDRIAVFVPSSGLGLRRAVAEQVFDIPDALITCPDAYLTRTSITQGPVYVLDEELGVWRDHGRNAGKDDRFGMEAFWVPVVMPAINEWYRDRGIEFSLLYHPMRIRDRVRVQLERRPRLYRLIRVLTGRS